MSNRLIFQGKCLQSTNGATWMVSHFDGMPSSIRRRLRESPFNLCAACVGDLALAKVMRNSMGMEKAYLSSINEMEEMIRAGSD